jgi:hypothetical protein
MSYRSFMVFVWLVIATVIGCAWYAGWLLMRSRGAQGFGDDAGIFAIQSILAALPFIAFAIAMRRHPAASVATADVGRIPRPLVFGVFIGLNITMLSYVAFMYDGLRADEGTSGAAIRLGWMMFVTPILVGILLRAVFRSSARDGED